jgi:hypothetical protein
MSKYLALLFLAITSVGFPQGLQRNTKYTVGLSVDANLNATYVYLPNVAANVLGFGIDTTMVGIPMGTGTGQIPLIPIPMASIPSVKTILDQITANTTPAAYKDVSFFATAAQGALAASALQSQVQSDWTGTGLAAVLHKPTLATVATSGAYGDLSGRPSLATVATSGSYADLSSKPTLGTAAAQNSTVFATSTQGTKADSALQSFTETDPVASLALTNHAALTTTAHGGIATTAQGAKADTAVQSGTAPLSVAGTAMSLAAATQSVAGSMSAADKVKLDGIASWTFGSPINATRTIQTVAAAANGWQLSSTRNATVSYSAALTTTTTIGGPSDGSVVLEVCPTNSATAASWITVNTMRASQTATLAVVLNLTSVNTSTVVGIVPAGYFVRLRSITTSGTFSSAFISGQEILQ